MNPEEYAALARVEHDHWFYRGKRDIVHHWLDRLTRLRRDDLVIDIGAGTGQLLEELAADCRAVGIEYHPAGLGIAAARSVQLIQGSILELPLSDDIAAAVTALDVIEHVDDDEGALVELIRVTRPGGWIFVLVPAFPILWSDWDEALGHKRRYTKPALMKLMDRVPLSVHHCAYVNSAAFLPILAYRWVRSKLSQPGGQRLEDKVPAAALNRILHALFVVPARWAWFSPPFGVSIFCVAQKSDHS